MRDSSLPGWQLRREALVSGLGRLAEFIAERGDPATAGVISASAARLAEGRLTLAVLGEFKRGKSTLINSLLEATVLPVGVIPMTSVPLRLEYGAEPLAEVEFEGGRRLRIGLDDLTGYGTETGNPHNQKRVVAISIRHPAPLLQQGIILVDTPGIGSVHAHNTTVAYAHLRDADAAIFVFSVDNPASQAEVEFLAATKAQVSRVFFVLNKADLVTSDELAQSVEFVRSVLADAVGDPKARLFPMSARGRDSGYTDFVAELERFLVGERGEFLLARAQEVARLGASSARNQITVERAALAISSEDATHRVAQLDQRLAEVRRRRLEVEEILSGDLRRVIATVVDPSLGRFRQLGGQRIASRVEAELASPAPERALRLEQALSQTVRELVGQWLTELEGELDQALAEVARRHSQRTNELIASATDAVSQVLQVELSDLTLGAALAPRGQRLVLVDDQVLALELVSSALKRLVPGRLGTNLARRDALRRGEELIDRHCGRVRHDIVGRLSQRERTWRDELRQGLEAVEQSVERAMELAAKAQADGAAGVRSQLQQLDQGSRSLEALLAQIES